MEGDKKPYLLVLVIQSIYAGMFLLTKVAFDDGMSTSVFVFYRQAAATVFLAPIAILLERKTAPPISFTNFLMIFMVSFIGISTSLNIYGVALRYTSATLAAATTNSLPVITFILALLFRIEKLDLTKVSGIIKVLGIALCMGGAATIAFYRGPTLKLLLHHHLISHHYKQFKEIDPSAKTWVKGVFLMILANTCWSLWLVLQGHVLRAYPSKLLCTTLQCFFSTIQSFIIAIAMERNPIEWHLGWDVKLVSVTYCGIVVTAFTFYLQAWVVEMKGPLFLSMTTPLCLIITTATSIVLLGEVVNLGSILGGLLLVGGLYSVLWGKKEEQKMTQDTTILVEEIEKVEAMTKTAEDIVL